jgi:hypothetical protein
VACSILDERRENVGKIMEKHGKNMEKHGTKSSVSVVN